MNLIVFALIMLAVIFNTAAQLFLKFGMDRIGKFSFSLANTLPICSQVATNPYIIGGIAVYVGSVVIWLMVLSRIPVSMAYPMTSIGYVTSAIAAYYLLGENLSIPRILGILIIIVGVFMVAKS